MEKLTQYMIFTLGDGLVMDGCWVDDGRCVYHRYTLGTATLYYWNTTIYLKSSLIAAKNSLIPEFLPLGMG